MEGGEHPGMGGGFGAADPANLISSGAAGWRAGCLQAGAVRVAAMDGFGFVAGEFHPQFGRNALIRQRACETVPQRMERAPGKLPHARAFYRLQIQARFPHDAFESFGKAVPSAHRQSRHA